MKFLVPQGIGDAVWALHKVESIRDALAPSEPIDVSLCCSDIDDLQSRALDFVRRFEFVSTAKMKFASIHRVPPILPSGRWNYIEDGRYEFGGEEYTVLIPNAALERGERLESWLPKYSINWDIFERFRLNDKERTFGATLRNDLGDYCVFYPGPLSGNTIEGHNRNLLWTPGEWIELGRRIRKEFSLPIVVVGAPYDFSYYDRLIAPALNGDHSYWHSVIGKTGIGELFSVTNQAKFVISYQAGVGIVATYLGTPTAIFWRPEGDSISQAGYLSFSEKMASAWVPPRAIRSGTHLPLIYGRHKVEFILDEIRNRGWA